MRLTPQSLYDYGFVVCSVTKSTTFSLQKALVFMKAYMQWGEGFQKNMLVVSLTSPTKYSHFKFTVNERESEIILGNRK